jgi:hypothetical protein
VHINRVDHGRDHLAMDRFWSKVDMNPHHCWEWTRATTKGYGAFRVNGKTVQAHRFAYELAMGPIPEGLELRHTCDNPPCVRPDHLIPGTSKENTQDMLCRGRATGGRAGATHCVQGHEYTEENTYWEPRGWGRACKTCRRQRVREYRARKAAEKCVS